MDLKVVKLASMESTNSSEDFLKKINSKLMMDVNRNQIVENDEWIEMLEFSLPHIEKALTKEIKNIITEEEIIKIELIKKVTVESVKHLSKNVNYVDRFNQKTGEVIPKKILNAYKEETFITYENRFLYSLIKLIEDYMYLREKDQQTEYKGKNQQKANYEAEVRYKKEKINVKFDYSTESVTSIRKSAETAEKIQDIKKKIKDLKTTTVYQLLDSKRVTLVKSPIKMTNVLLKNVHFQYALKLWNYLSDQMEIKDKAVQSSKDFEEKGITRKLVDENLYLMHLIFKNQNIEDKIKGKRKSAIEDKKIKKELTDELIEKIIELNPDLSDKELKQMLTDKLIIMKTRKLVSLKPIEDRFKDRIEKYLMQAKEVRLK